MISARRAPGFTLLEVVLAITILSALAIMTTQAISRALKARTKIQAEVDDVSALRDSARMLKSDINKAFHHLDFEKELSDLVNKPATPQGREGAPPPPAAPAPPQRQTKRVDPVTHFVGSENEVNFVTMNTGRMSDSVAQADFVEVGYSLKNCNNLTTGTASQCLHRRTANLVDEDVGAGGNEIVMLENVTEFKLRYIGEGKQDWVSQWNSTANSPDAGTRARFPDAVEVSLSIEREIENKPRTYSMQLVIPLHFPNNAPVRTTSPGTTAGSPPAETPGSGGAP